MTSNVTIYLSAVRLYDKKMRDQIFSELAKLFKLSSEEMPDYEVASVRQMASCDVWVKVRMDLGFLGYGRRVK